MVYSYNKTLFRNKIKWPVSLKKTNEETFTSYPVWKCYVLYEPNSVMFSKDEATNTMQNGKLIILETELIKQDLCQLWRTLIYFTKLSTFDQIHWSCKMMLDFPVDIKIPGIPLKGNLISCWQANYF